MTKPQRMLKVQCPVDSRKLPEYRLGLGSGTFSGHWTLDLGHSIIVPLSESGIPNCQLTRNPVVMLFDRRY